MKQKKTYYLLLILLFANVATTAIAQMTYVPDANFRQALADIGVTGIVNDSVPTVEISAIAVLDVTDKGIADLTGIADFAALERLICPNNQLIALDVSKNSELEMLYCNNNNLTTLDVSKNMKLVIFGCQYNALTSLDISKNNLLIAFYCNNNLLTSLDVRNGNNSNFSDFYVNENPHLTCIYVDDKEAAYLSNWYKDDVAYFVNNETECTTVSVNTITEQQISIYPNPTSGIVHVDLAGKKIQNLKLIDVTGKIVIGEF